MNDNEEHSRLLREEPTYQHTTPANPYEPPTDYGLPSIPPPPPSPMRRKWWYVVVPILMIVALIATIVIPNIVTPPKQPTHTSTNHIDPDATATAEAVWTQSALDTTATASVPIPTPTQILTPTPTKNPNYTADDIVQAFQAAGLPTDNLSHYDTFGNTGMTAIHALSSADFTDQSLCGGFNCGEDAVNLNVYASVGDATEVYQQFERWIQNPPGPYRNYPYQAGRCFMDGEPLTSVYVQIVKADCI
jgi:hypothetical protein